MLFNSYPFLFVFLPVLLIGLLFLSRFMPRYALAWLTLASLAFYAWGSAEFLHIILASIGFNYVIGRQLAQWRSAGRATFWLLCVGVGIDIAVLGYYKYAGFFQQVVLDTSGVDLGLGKILLPVGISFFTFTQIAYLVDAHRGLAREYDFLRYCLFVTFFPHLVAGPILHHREMMPQFKRGGFRFSSLDLSAGAALFAIGLCKKVLLADSVAPIADQVFSNATEVRLTMAEAWLGALAYTLQIYFDFSGYSDMALGLSRMIGIRLPLNFNSPYQATSIIEFWRRWHMTLSRFLRDYLYIPLGGSRKGGARRYANLMATMVLGGLWHGAGWTFIAWGALHGAYLGINHLWRSLRGAPAGPAERVAGWMVTFLAVIVAWVFFRAQDMEQAMAMLNAMAGAHDMVRLFPNGLVQTRLDLATIAALLVIAISMPNSQRLVARYRPAFERVPVLTRRLSWRPTVAWGLALGGLCGVAITLVGGASPFLYFQF